ncbi:MAG: histidine kinase [Nitrospirales bacterium]|nr:histidine kinase [Nitrospirales bacterium]
MSQISTLAFDLEESSGQGHGMVAFVDPKSHQIVECNDSLSEALGVAKTQILGETVFQVFTSKSRRSAEKVYRSFLKTQSVSEAELELEDTDGKGIPVTLRLSGARDEKGKIHCTRFSWHNISDLKKETNRLREKVALGLREVNKRGKHLQKEVERRKTTQSKLRNTVTLLRRRAKETRILAKRVIGIQEAERRRLARDLHDETNQKLAFLSLQVAGLMQGLPMKTDQLQQHLQSVLDNISSLANEVRQLAHQLHPAVLEHLGFVEAMEAYIAEISQSKEFEIVFRHRNVHKTIPLELSLCLYRVAQECLGNVIKHAHARTIQLSFVGFAKSLRLSIRDDGIGMTPKQFRGLSQGLGFVSMRERVRLVKGRLRIKSKPRKGTEIHITVPRVENIS